MDYIFEIFSTREVATIIFITVLLLLLSFAKGVGRALLGFVKILANKFFIKLFITSAAYTSFCVLILYSLNLWNIHLFKDTCIWFLFSSLFTVMRLHKAKDFTFFTKIIKDNIKIIFVYEFFVNLYTFSLTTELIIVSLISTLGILNVAAEMQQEKDPSVRKVHSCLNNAMIMVGVGLFVFTTYKTITEYKTIFTILTLKSFLLPIFLTILSLPYFYALAMYMEYESLYVIVKHRERYNSPKIFKSLIAATCIHANVNINKLGRVRKYYTFFNPEKDNPYKFIKTIANKPKYKIGVNAKLTLFNNVKSIILILSQNGIGSLDFWMRKGEYYHSSTNLYNFKTSEQGITDNSLQYILSGDECSVHQISINLNIGLGQNLSNTLIAYSNLIDKTFKSLDMVTPDKLHTNVMSFNNMNIELPNYEVYLDCTKSGEIGWCSLCINSKLADGATKCYY